MLHNGGLVWISKHRTESRLKTVLKDGLDGKVLKISINSNKSKRQNFAAIKIEN